MSLTEADSVTQRRTRRASLIEGPRAGIRIIIMIHTLTKGCDPPSSASRPGCHGVKSRSRVRSESRSR